MSTKVRSKADFDRQVTCANDATIILHIHRLGSFRESAATTQIARAALKLHAHVYDMQIAGSATASQQTLLDAFEVYAFPTVLVYNVSYQPFKLSLASTIVGPHDDFFYEIVTITSSDTSSVKGSHSHSSKASGSEYEHDHGGPTPATNGAPYVFSKFKNRDEAFKDPFVVSALNKCIACHIMNPFNDPKRDAKGTNPGRLITIESLQDAIVGEDGTFNRKRLREFADADARHIHFSARDLTAIKNLYLTEEKAVEPFERRLAPDLVQSDSWRELVKTFPNRKPQTRSQAIRNPVLTYAAIRCLMCHNDPLVSESGASVEGVNTLSKMRKTFLTLDKATLDEMLKRAYETPQQYHIQDVEYSDTYDDGTQRTYKVPLRTALEELVQMPVESK